MKDCPLVWIVMGVAGSGKSAVGRLLAERLGSDFLEGDLRHSRSNILKMLSQTPLEDEDRRQWLLEIEEDLQRAIARDRETVMTCSALKVTYRQQLTALGRVQLVWLKVPELELKRRLASRTEHYMKPEMLQSQIAAFEPIDSHEDVMILDGSLPPREIVRELIERAKQLFPSLNDPWWERGN